MKTPKKYTTQNVASYTVFYQENRPKMTSKYPFLTADQINCRLRDQWKKLAKGEKKNFSIPKVCSTPSKANTGIRKKVKAEDQEIYKSVPNKQLFYEDNPKIETLMLSKSLKQKSVADWLDTSKQKLPQPKTYSGVTNPVKDVPEVYDRTPHIKTGILKNTERSLSLDKCRSEGRTPAKVTFTPINKKGRKSTITQSLDIKTSDESNSMEYIQPKNLNHELEMEEDGHPEVESYTCDFDDDGEEDDECYEIDREEYSDSDDDNLLHYHHENEEDDSQQTEELDPKTPVSPACKNNDQMILKSSDASSEICTTASNTPKASKAPKPLKNGLTTPSQCKRTLRPRKRNTSPEDPVLEIPSFEKGISPKMFGIQKDRGAKKQAKTINDDNNHQKEKPVSGVKELIMTNLKDCQEPDVSQSKQVEIVNTDKPTKRKKIGQKNTKKKDGDKVADDEKLGCRRATKRKTRNKNPVYDEPNLKGSEDYENLGNITSKKKMKTKVLPGLFDDDIELTSKEECIKNQDKLISEFAPFQYCEDKIKKKQDDDVKSGVDCDFNSFEIEELHDRNEIPVKDLYTMKSIKTTPKTTKSKQIKKPKNLNLNNNKTDNEFADMDKVIEDCDEHVKKVNQDINNNSSESLDDKDGTSLFGLKSFIAPFKMGKQDSFSSSYDDDFEDNEDQPDCSTGNDTLQKLLCNLRQIGSQSSIEDEKDNILDADDGPMHIDESPKILSPTLSGVSELSSLSEKENNPVDKLLRQNKESSGKKQLSRVKPENKKKTKELQKEEPPEFLDVNNKVIPRGEICEMFDEISPLNKKSKKAKERRQYYYWAQTTVSDLCAILGCRHQTLTYLSQIRSE